MTNWSDYHPIVFTDLVGSKLAMHHLPAYWVRWALREHSASALDIATGLWGTGELAYPATNLGDGNLFIFTDIDDALLFALRLSGRWRGHHAEHIAPQLVGHPGLSDRDDILKLRIGVHLGPVYEELFRPDERGVTFSEAINATFVLQHLAEPGCVVVSETAVSLSSSSLFHSRYLGRFDPLDRGEDAPEDERRAYYELVGLAGTPPKPDTPDGVPVRVLRRMAADWCRRGLALGDDSMRGEEAVECYRHSVSLDPFLADAWSNLSRQFARLDRFDEALETAERAVEVAPDNARALNTLAVFLDRWAGRYEEAKQALLRAIALDPNLALAHNNLALIYAREGKLEVAEESCRRANKLNPYRHEFVYNTACVLARQDRTGEALDWLARAVEMYPPYAKKSLEDEYLVSLRKEGRFIELTSLPPDKDPPG